MPGTRRTSVASSLVISILAAGGLGALGASCSDGADPVAVTVADSAGVRILTSAGPPPAGARPPGLELDLTVGSVDGPDAFGRLVDVGPRRVGGLWVVDAQARRVRGFDERGREVLAFGGPGDGPGEFRSVGRIAELPDGGLLVGGRMPLELYRFDARGAYVGTHPVPTSLIREVPDGEGPDRPPLGPTLGEWAFAADGSAFLHAVATDAPVEDIVRSDVVLRLARGDRPGVRFARWESPAVIGGPGGRARLLQPTASWSPLSDGGVWLTYGDRYELRRHGTDGELRSILRRPLPRIPADEELKAAFRASLAAEAENPMMLAMLERAVFPDSLPATLGLWAVEGEDELWVGVVDPDLPLRLDEPNAWDVFGADGGYVGRVGIPEGLRPTRVTSGHVYGVWKDELEVTHARRYRIVREE